jgi:hypothetical protein
LIAMRLSDSQRKANRRLGWILASLAAAFAAGFVVRMTWFGF